MKLNSQILRIVIAGVIAVGGLVAMAILASLQVAIPQLIATLATGAMFYLFGVVTNGSGLGGGTPPTKTP